jgi:septal ring factor EnvC (AmiA/AmiB activator)
LTRQLKKVEEDLSGKASKLLDIQDDLGKVEQDISDKVGKLHDVQDDMESA